MTRFTVFISDLHLDEAEPAKTQKFFELLTTQAKHADALYILGDFFEAWVGDDNNSELAAKIKQHLSMFSQETPVFIMQGNRDFLIGNRLAKETGCIIIDDPTVIDLYGIKTVLTHGDLLCTKDYWHLRFRKVANIKILQNLFLLLPLIIRRRIAKVMRNISKKRKTRPDVNEPMISLDAIIDLMRIKKAHIIIHGHIHKPEIKDIPFDGDLNKKICLPNWDDAPEILIYKSNHQLYFEKI